MAFGVSVYFHYTRTIPYNQCFAEQNYLFSSLFSFLYSLEKVAWGAERRVKREEYKKKKPRKRLLVSVGCQKMDFRYSIEWKWSAQAYRHLTCRRRISRAGKLIDQIWTFRRLDVVCKIDGRNCKFNRKIKQFIIGHIMYPLRFFSKKYTTSSEKVNDILPCGDMIYRADARYDILLLRRNMI